MNKKIIIYIILIIIILVAVFFSQQVYSRDAFKNVLSMIEKYSGASLLGGFNNLNSENTNIDNNKTSTDSSSDSTSKSIDAYSTANTTSAQLIDTSNIAPGVPLTIGDYIAKGVETVSQVPGKVIETIQNGGATIQNGINQQIENISAAEKNIENYFTGIKNSIVNPGANNNCTTPTK